MLYPVPTINFSPVQVRYLDEDHVFSPEQVTAMMLTKLKETATIGLNMKIIDCVISVSVADDCCVGPSSG